jgi:predicted nucleotidyltransferase
VPEMSTSLAGLSHVLFGQSRRSILALLYGHADEEFYLRDLVRKAGTALGATQRELKQLADVGIVQRVRRGHQVYYQANRDNPIFSELKSILTKTVGVHDLVKDALMPLTNRIRLAFIYGSVARQEERASSDIDLMVIGEVGFNDVVSSLGEAEKRLGREINPTVYSVEEFRAKRKAKNHFLSTVLRREKLFVIGGQNELARLG